jgi:hypothetical protein
MHALRYDGSHRVDGPGPKEAPAVPPVRSAFPARLPPRERVRPMVLIRNGFKRKRNLPLEKKGVVDESAITCYVCVSCSLRGVAPACAGHGGQAARKTRANR